MGVQHFPAHAYDAGLGLDTEPGDDAVTHVRERDHAGHVHQRGFVPTRDRHGVDVGAADTAGPLGEGPCMVEHRPHGRYDLICAAAGEQRVDQRR